jgi:hypothetical protein
MENGQTKTISNMLRISAGKARIFALLLVVSISVNNACPRAIMELKNYDVVVLAMGSQSVFLHLFALPSRVSLELANLLFGDSGIMAPVEKTNHKNIPKAGHNSSADYSLLSLDASGSMRLSHLGAVYSCDTCVNLTKIIFANLLFSLELYQFQAMLYFILMLIYFSRPRGDVSTIADKTINSILKPGSSFIAGFSFCLSKFLTLREIRNILFYPLKGISEY